MEKFANSSSAHNDTLSSSPDSPLPSCFASSPGSFIFSAATITNILLLLPLSICILFLGFQSLWKQRGGASVNPSDLFTYHMVTMEMVGICGSIFCCCGTFMHHRSMTMVGCNVFVIVSCVKMFFHSLTCVERYLAVVHPITYLNLTQVGGVTVRNACTACVWIVCTGLMAVRFIVDRNFNLILFFCSLVSSVIIISFCSLSVLCVLSRPGPGDGSKNKADKTKQRAFVTITAIMAVLLLRLMGNLVCQALASSSLLSQYGRCAAQMSGIWFCLPSSYVLPLLFLLRAGKLLCFKHTTDS